MSDFPPLDELADEDDELDASGIDYTEDPVPDDEIDMVVLNPNNDPAVAEAYRELFQAGKPDA